ncbi:MAG: PolC-type DNA polymerase III [Eubacteriaceae bacterium]|jgi:DNA polymerase-3 subunit alpha (Gram-positive type)|nr:PolC-type DNA polymerase III [Eubacteriaceae bacterium]
MSSDKGKKMQKKYLRELIDVTGIEYAKDCRIEKVVLAKDGKAVFHISTLRHYEQAQIEVIKERIARSYSFIEKIQIVQTERNADIAKYLAEHRGELLKEIARGEERAVLLLGQKWNISEDKIEIPVYTPGHFEELREQQIPEKIAAWVKNRLHEEVVVKLVEAEKLPENISKDATEPAAPDKQPDTVGKKKKAPAASRKTSSQNEKSNNATNATFGEVLYGRMPKQKKGILAALQEKLIGGTIVAQGRVFFSEIIDTRLRSFIKLYLHDGETSAEARINADKDSIEHLHEKIKKTRHVCISGKVGFDEYNNERYIQCYGMQQLHKQDYFDNAEKKRVELHCHTQYSERDAVSKIEDIFFKLDQMGHKTVAITDHGGVYAYPDAYELSQKYGIKIIYGMEAYMINDENLILSKEIDQKIDDEIIVLDVETTGLSARVGEIIEIGAVKIKNNAITEEFSTLVKPTTNVSARITEITSITQAMLEEAPPIAVALQEFLEFCGSCKLICSYNASFDSAFIDKALRQAEKQEDFVYLDALHLSRRVFPELKTHKLKSVTKHLKLENLQAHRALSDALVTAKILLYILNLAKKDQINKVYQLIDYKKSAESDRRKRHHHCILLAKNQQGIEDMYRMISHANIHYFYRRPKILKSEIRKYKQNLIVGSACDGGEVYQAFVDERSETYLSELADFYDYLEIQPLGNSIYLVDEEVLRSSDDIIEINREIIRLAKQKSKPFVATGDVHFLDAKDSVYRAVLMNALKYDNAEVQAPLYLRSTAQMLEEFSYLDKETAQAAVVDNPVLIAQRCEEGLVPVRQGSFPPVIEGVGQIVSDYIYEKAHIKYGSQLPELIEKRIEKELAVIDKYNYSALYYLAQKVVHKAHEDGYLVGSRGSVGSSFAATLLGITEVNPLPPHYVCPKCQHTEFADAKRYGVGADLPDKLCIKCQTPYEKDGFDIPFECFLGFEGDKEPDIDLNFASDYQGKIHRFVEEMLGEQNVFRSGTISKVASSLARNYVRKYMEECGHEMNMAEQKRLEIGCSEVKSTTGQHPGGLIVLPEGLEIFQFTPVQYPANDASKGVITTCFDYDALKGRLLKLDLLGHDDPTMINALQKLTNFSVKDIKLDDEKVMSLFTSTEALNLKDNNILTDVGTYGVPEFGTKFVREMLRQANPQCFDDLIRISGLSHGRDVWTNNAVEYIKNKTATIKNVISTRDSIMVYLMQMNMDAKSAFDIMERVRKGKGLTESDTKKMRALHIEEWYIDSCNKIKYMFPKAHAAAYVMMGFRVAYYKVYYPLQYYCAYFSIRSKDFDTETILKGPGVIRKEIGKYYSIKNLTPTQKDTLTSLELALEMLCRGYRFETIIIGKSHYNDFIISGDSLILPYKVIEGAGEKVTKKIYEESKKEPFSSIEDLKKRTSASTAVIEALQDMGALEGVQKTDQFSFF